MVSIQKLRQHLQSGTAIVTFKKKNGEIREMECTLMEYLLPEVHSTRPVPGDVTTVFDLEKEAWRAFRNDSVTNVELL